MDTQEHITQNLSTEPAQYILNNDDQISLKEETIKWIMSFICSLWVYLVPFFSEKEIFYILLTY